MSEDREPQNIEYKMLNIEGKENFIFRNSLFDLPAMQARRGGRVLDIQNRGWVLAASLWFLAVAGCYLTSEPLNIEPLNQVTDT